MGSVTYEHPLKLPEGWHTTPVNGGVNQTSFPPTLTIDDAIRYLEDEAEQLAMSFTLYSNYKQITNARLRKQIGRGNGVAIIITSAKSQYHFACDKWTKLEHNIYALHLAIRSFRNLEKWGIASIGFIMSALSNSVNYSNHSSNPILGGDTTTSAPDWMNALGLGPTATIEDANAVYRRRAKALANDENALLELNNSMDDARKYLR